MSFALGSVCRSGDLPGRLDTFCAAGPVEASPRVIDAILTYVDERLVANPMRLSKPLRGDFAGLRSARSGDYRVLIKIDQGQQTIFVRSVDHRAARVPSALDQIPAGDSAFSAISLGAPVPSRGHRPDVDLAGILVDLP